MGNSPIPVSLRLWCFRGDAGKCDSPRLIVHAVDDHDLGGHLVAGRQGDALRDDFVAVSVRGTDQPAGGITEQNHSI